MDSPQSVVSPFKGLSVFAEPEKQKADLMAMNPGCLSMGVEVQSKEAPRNVEAAIGVLEVYIHQARDIHNICIYHKQDVYAKLCLTSDPEDSVSTQIINGGGKNPVFKEKLHLRVRTIDSSLKCEIWMLSRVRNYLEDQLLGFALVPLSEVLVKDGKLEKEFSLSSTDLFHAPAGFVQLSLSYSGATPEVIPLSSVSADSEVTASLGSEFDKIEFPDPKIVNENHLMVSEYFGIPCTNLDSQCSESLVTSVTGKQLSSETGIHFAEDVSTGSFEAIQLLTHDSPPSSLSTNGSQSICPPVSSQSCETTLGSKSVIQESVSPLKENLKEKREEAGDAESSASVEVPVDTFTKPVITVNIEPEQKVVQQDIVDMYMKSMQQFTESLAKMKLPMDSESGHSSSENSSSDQKLEASKNTGSRVFYGSRAFF